MNLWSLVSLWCMLLVWNCNFSTFTIMPYFATISTSTTYQLAYVRTCSISWICPCLCFCLEICAHLKNSSLWVCYYMHFSMCCYLTISSIEFPCLHICSCLCMCICSLVVEMCKLPIHLSEISMPWLQKHLIVMSLW